METRNEINEQGNPSGGHVRSVGLSIDWQNGPMREGGVEQEQNGAFAEDVLNAALQRLEFYQSTKFKCRENALAITKIEEAIMWLQRRQARRTKEGTQGTYKGA